jgi:hypothetical protein
VDVAINTLQLAVVIGLSFRIYDWLNGGDR